MSTAATAKQLAEKACAFLTASTDPFHAVRNAALKLEAAGYVRVVGGAAALAGSISPGGKYYYTVQNSTLVAFAVGAEYATAATAAGGGGGSRDSNSRGGGGAFHVIGGHTDSPNLRVKPRSKRAAAGGKGGCALLAVECYGGGLWHTWFDRDLSISGKVLVRDPQSNRIAQRLVQFKDPVARVSTLCIHLQSASEREAFAVNKEDHTSPIIGSITSKNEELEKSVEEQINGDAWLQGQDPALLTRIASELGISVAQIADFDLSLYDTQPAAVGGMNGEFLYSARLDNLATVFAAVTALSEHSPAASQDVAMIVCFDHEEVGSVSANGAGSPVLHEAVKSISAALGNTADQHAAAVAKSFCLSIDQAHAVHPNYASKHEAMHSPVMNGGVVIKTNSNQRYTTNSLTGFVVRELGKKCGIPVQEFCVRNDCPCGSTIGPTISALTGIRTVDAGMPQLSMHSCREVMGVRDLQHGLELFKCFFSHFREIDERIDVTISA